MSLLVLELTDAGVVATNGGSRECLYGRRHSDGDGHVLWSLG
jgi:hypothetical protein